MSNIFGNLGASQQQPASSVFGSSTVNTSKPSLFGSLNTTMNTSQPAQTNSGFGNLGSHAIQPPGTGLFGSSSQPQQSSSVFGSSTQPQQTGGVFGSTAPSRPQQGSGLFGPAQQPHQQQQQGTSLFSSIGQSAQQSQQQPQQQQGSSLFGSLGQNAQQPQQQQQGGSLFGSLGQNVQQSQQQQGSGLFGSLSHNAQQPQQPQMNGLLSQTTQQLQPAQQQFQGPSQSQQGLGSSIWQPPHEYSGQKTVPQQILLVAQKWDPASSNALFQSYLYNSVDPDTAAFYRPGPEDDEAKWEEALRKRPSPGAIPVLIKGFGQLALRLKSQYEHIEILQGRLHEINSGLTSLLQHHDLELSTRTAECRRKHLRLSQKSLTLATKVQVLRNRGYAMDGAEEELRQKLLQLEKKVFDPALNGRGEEIWARMVGTRERCRQLQQEFERAGKDLSNEQEQEIDEEVLKRAKKILEDYNSQLSHLTKELEHIRKDLGEWELSNSAGNSAGSPQVRDR